MKATESDKAAADRATEKYVPVERLAQRQIVKTTEQTESLIAACSLLIDQYEARPNFTMGGCLTNEPFMKIRDVLQQIGVEPKRRLLFDVKQDGESNAVLVLAVTADEAVKLSGKDRRRSTAVVIF